MAYTSIGFSPGEFTDSTVDPGSDDNTFTIGGLTFVVQAQGNWSLNFSGERMNFTEDSAFASEQFVITVTPANGGTFSYNDFLLRYDGAPLSNAYLLFGHLSTGDSDISGTGGPLDYSSSFSPSPYWSSIQIKDSGFLPDDPNPTSSFWLDDFSVDILAPPPSPPTATGLTQAAPFTEDAVGGIALGDIVVSDLNMGDVITATLTLSNPSAGSMSTGTFGSATSTYNGVTGTWTVSGGVADVNAALAAVSFSPSANWNQNVTISTAIRDAANTGPALGVITLIGTAINDAPVLTGGGVLTAVGEDTSSPAGAALNSLGISAADTADGGAIAGYAIVGNAADSATQGTWQYSTNGGANWHAIGTVDDSTGALALSASTLVRFVPASNFNGTPAPLDIRALDGNVSVFSAGDATETRVTIDATARGGETSTSASTAQISTSVTAANDAPVNGVPSSQNVEQDAVLVFNAANGNLISVDDVDVGGGSMRLSLAASDGTLTLGSVAGLTFIAGSGSSDASMTFEGALSDINAALDGMSFTPTPGYHGAATISMVSSDLGLSGTGGVQTDTDTISVDVQLSVPTVVSVATANPDGTYKTGDVITVAVSFDQAVFVNTNLGSPTLLLETGLTDRAAAYVSGSGTNIVSFTYTVVDGDESSDLDYASSAALSLNGATIRNAYDTDAVLSLPAVGGSGSLAFGHSIGVDGIRPSAPTATLVVDSGASSSDGITNDGTVKVDGVETGGTWQHSSDQGTSWSVGTGTTFSLTTDGPNYVLIRQVDAAGNLSEATTVEVLLDDTAPVVAGATVTGAELVLTFGESLDALNTATPGNFSVLVNGLPVAIQALGLDAVAGTVTLELVSPVKHGQAVSISYTDPTNGDDASAIQDLAGNDAVSVSAVAVANNTPRPNPQPPEPPPTGTPAGDLLQGTSGDDRVDGGGGTDTFQVMASRDEVIITRLADGTVTISHPDFGTDMLDNVELIRFNDIVEVLNPPAERVSLPNTIPFNESAYLSQNPDVADAVARGEFSNGFEHYTRFGEAEGRNIPMVALDEQFYLSQNEDVALAVERGEFGSALEHYLLHGAAEGRSPNVLFDESWYLDQNPDVAAGLLEGAFESAYEHFQIYGWKEGRDPSPWMDTDRYLAENEDVALVGLNPLDHFLNFGIHEGRTIQPLDAAL